MGAYLSSPVTDKISSDGSCTAFTYGASSMQGWRISQEDAHNCIPELDSKTSMFAVYDGHGGSEVAQYCAKYLPECIKNTDQYKEGELGPALTDAFLKFDATLVQDDVIKELKVLADDDPVGRGEADDLRAEADLPLDELLAKYQTPPGGAAARNLRKKENLQSPVVGAKSSKTDPDAGPSSSTDGAGSSGGSASNASPSTGLTNGVADNENNLNKEKELRDSTPSQPVDGAGDSNCSNSADKISSSSSGVHSAAGDSSSGEAGKASSSSADSTSSSGDAGRCGSSSAGGSSDVSSAVSSSAQSPSKSSDPGSDGVSSSTSGVEEGSSSGADSKVGGGSTRSSSKGAKNGAKKTEEDMDDDSDDDDEDDEDEWQDLSGEEEEDDEEEGMDDTDEPVMDMSNEEPGSDSGCTACVALMHGDHLVVGNAGDSRCVLCRGGVAVDLSIDHKPEDEIERNRIEKAGGKVTADGRVNGGLNLSRAIGDHFYKRKEGLPAEQQMITSLPDIQSVAVVPEDQFLVLACDGIWNSMSSQECVDFVAERLKDPVKKNKPSLICEELFNHCLAANTYGDGTGCDNMTCVIIVLHQAGQSPLDGSSLAPIKRCVGDVEAPEENSEKRPRVEEEGAGSTSG
ncbi:protein phosphatase 1G-like isoform X2 [Littorina saxatilis]|uniref:protein-serine/threonine phosphatase n=1 Tax=Littorina saxatilis TaxID=31220 RepID=A0AAN9GBT4_9CAEN